MIELRWRKGFVRLGEGYGRMDNVLQYRVFRTYRIEGDDGRASAVKLADWSDAYGWSEWQDVPEVSEGAAAPNVSNSTQSTKEK